MSFFSMFAAMIKLLVILLVGYCCHRWKVFPEGTQGALTRLVLYVTAPCTIVYGVLTNDNLPHWTEVLRLLGLSFLCYGILIVLSMLLLRVLRIPDTSRGAYLTMLVFSNCLFIGLPVVSAIYGGGALLYLSIFSLPFYPFLYIQGVYMMMQDHQHRVGSEQRLKVKLSDMLNPCLIGGLIAIFLAVVQIKVPPLVTDIVGLFNGATTPASLLVIGISIAKMPLRSVLGSPRIYIVSVFRLLVFPVLVWLVLAPFVSDPMIRGVAMVVHAMPVAAAVPMLAFEYGSDEDATAQGVFVTTLLSMLTIPLLVTLLS